MIKTGTAEIKSAAQVMTWKCSDYSKRQLFCFFLVLAAFFGAWFAFSARVVAVPALRASLAFPSEINSALPILAKQKAFFATSGVHLAMQPTALSRDALQALLDDKADFALVTDTDFVLSKLAGHDVLILASLAQARRTLALVTSGLEDPRDLQGKEISLRSEPQAHYFLDSFLQIHGLDEIRVKRIENQTLPELGSLLDAFKAKQIAAAVVRQPVLGQLQMAMGKQLKVFYGDDVYAMRLLLLVKPSYFARNRPAIKAVLTALIDASKAIRDQPSSARRLIGTFLQLDDTLMSRFFDPEDFVVSLDQALLLSLEDQSRWAIKKGLATTASVMPNYLQMMRLDALETVMPDAVKIVR
ncbi:MAG: ABC transporter substrate-binding protein [Pseudomonadota bacterium]